MEHDLPKLGCLVFVCFFVISGLKQGNNKLSLTDVIVCRVLLTLYATVTNPSPHKTDSFLPFILLYHCCFSNVARICT